MQRTGPTSFGFKRENGKLVADPDEAPIRRRVFKLFLKHKRKKTVAEILNAEGHRTRAGSYFSSQTIERLLRDELAKGKIGMADALVSSDLWRACNAILDDQKASGGVVRKPRHIFAGLAHCSCGQKMYVPSGSDKYVCGTCRNKIPARDLEHIVATKLRDVTDPKDVHYPLLKQWKKLSLADQWEIVDTLLERIEIMDNLVTLSFIQLSKT